MSTVTAIILGCTFLAPEPGLNVSSYAEAHRVCLETGQPMLVMVGAKWCPACKDMEKEVLPQVQRRGLLRKVVFTIVDFDRSPSLGDRLTRGGPLPQLLLFRRHNDGWRVGRLIGRQDPAVVERFINQMVPDPPVASAQDNSQRDGAQKPAPTGSTLPVAQAQHQTAQ